MRDNDAILGGGPLENCRIVGARQPDVLNANDVDLRIASKQPAHDVAVEVLVHCQSQDRPAPLPPAGSQSFAKAGRRKPTLDFRPNVVGQLLATLEVSADLWLVPQVVCDHGVHVGQGDGGVLLRDLLGGRASIERTDDRVECDPSAGDTYDASMSSTAITSTS